MKDKVFELTNNLNVLENLVSLCINETEEFLKKKKDLLMIVSTEMARIRKTVGDTKIPEIPLDPGDDVVSDEGLEETLDSLYSKQPGKDPLL